MSKLHPGIRKRGKNSWAIKVDGGTDPITGKRIEIYKSVKGGIKAAQKERIRMMGEIEEGTYIAPTKETLAQVAMYWLENVAPESNTDGTVQGHQIRIEKHIIPHLGHILLSKLTGADIQAFYRQLRVNGNRRTGKGLAERSIIHAHSALSLILGWCVFSQKLKINPLQFAKPPSMTKRPERAVDLDTDDEELEDEAKAPVVEDRDLKTLLTYLSGRALYYPTLLAAATGMRRGEILGLKWKDIDFEVGALHVRRAIEQTDKFGIRKKVPKKHSKREIRLPAIIMEALLKYQKEQIERNVKSGVRSEHVFATWDGQVRSPNGFSSEFRREVIAAGIPHATFHMLRHTHASQLLRDGVPVTSVSKRLGHKDGSITLKIYAHVLEGMDDSAAEKTGQMMNKILGAG